MKEKVNKVIEAHKEIQIKVINQDTESLAKKLKVSVDTAWYIIRILDFVVLPSWRDK